MVGGNKNWFAKISTGYTLAKYGMTLLGLLADNHKLRHANTFKKLLLMGANISKLVIF